MEEEVLLINEVLNCDRYVAEAKLNEGSYGEIFRVRDKQTGELFALKAMELEKLHAMRKTHEAAVEHLLLRKLHHPGIIRLREVVQAPQYIGLVIELCPFGDIFSLMRCINRQIELAVKKRAILTYYLAQILETLEYLHGQHVVHRDLKPENVVLGSDLKVRLIDFGTAKIGSLSQLASPQELEDI
jgi:serine/threonine protein kinase